MTSAPAGRRVHRAEPETSEEAVRGATGRGWDEWCDLIEAWPGHIDGHAAIAGHLEGDLGVDGWWAQTVTVGYERITGRRLPHQRADGTFDANKSATIRVEATTLRRRLLDDGERSGLFPGAPTRRRSRPEAKTIRLEMTAGIAVISLDDRGDGRTKVTVQHGGLPNPGAVGTWKAFWEAWLVGLDGVS